jgi:hypothetical protein
LDLNVFLPLSNSFPFPPPPPHCTLKENVVGVLSRSVWKFFSLSHGEIPSIVPGKQKELVLSAPFYKPRHESASYSRVVTSCGLLRLIEPPPPHPQHRHTLNAACLPTVSFVSFDFLAYLNCYRIARICVTL